MRSFTLKNKVLIGIFLLTVIHLSQAQATNSSFDIWM